MLHVTRRLLEWNRERVEWNRRHVAAWVGQDVPGPSGLSPFQVLCEPRLVEMLERHGHSLEDRALVHLAGAGEPCVQAKISGMTREVLIYIDQAELLDAGKRSGVNLEQWDALTPEELVEKFVSAVEQALEPEFTKRETPR